MAPKIRRKSSANNSMADHYLLMCGYELRGHWFDLNLLRPRSLIKNIVKAII